MKVIDNRPFAPTANTVSISATTGSGNAAIAPVFSSDPELPGTCRVYNDGATAAAVKLGAGSGLTVAATADTSVLVPGKGAVTLLLPNGTDHVAAIMLSSTGTVYFTPGTGGIN